MKIPPTHSSIVAGYDDNNDDDHDQWSLTTANHHDNDKDSHIEILEHCPHIFEDANHTLDSSSQSLWPIL